MREEFSSSIENGAWDPVSGFWMARRMDVLAMGGKHRRCEIVICTSHVECMSTNSRHRFPGMIGGN